MGKTTSSHSSPSGTSWKAIKTSKNLKDEQMDCTEHFTSLELLEEHRRMRNKTRYVFKTISGKEWIKNTPNEVLVECLGFMNRIQLEKMQLVSGKFDILVDKYHQVYPLRKVQTCKIESKKNGQMKLSMACYSADPIPQNIVESNSDMPLWLRSCHVETCRFDNFYFTDRLLDELRKMDPRSLIINYCIFEYDRKTIKDNRQLKEKQLHNLFTIPAFKNCKGAIFSFTKATTWYRPSFHCILSLPLTTVVIDLDYYEASQFDLEDIVKWLDNEPILPFNHFPQQSDAAGDNNASGSSTSRSSPKTKTLSLRNVEFDMDQFTNMINQLKRSFLNDTTKRRPYMLETDFYPDVDYDDQGGPHKICLSNKVTGEKFVVSGNDFSSASIQRMKF